MKSMLFVSDNTVLLYAVIDTNVLVSAFLKENSIPRFVINYMYAGKIIPIYNEVETFVVTPRQILDLLEKPI